MTTKKTVLTPDSPEARQLAELAIFRADLAGARYGFEIARHLVDSSDRTERSFARPIITDAVLAYWRCFTKSNVRNDTLDRLIEMPAESADIHQALRTYRNRAIGHSESELQQSYPLIHLERHHDGRTTATSVSSVTQQPYMPAALLDDVINHIRAVLEQLTPALDAAKKALLATIDDTAAEELWEAGNELTMEQQPVDEWARKGQRKPYPETAQLFIQVDNDDSRAGELDLFGRARTPWKNRPPFHIS
ncbi:hypothetical protein [Agromyces bauzanensis]